MTEPKKQLVGNDHLLAWCAGLLLGGAALMKAWKWFVIWVSEPRHALALGLVVAYLLVLLAVWVHGKVTAHLEKKRYEESITGKTADAVYSGRTIEGKPVWIKTSQRSMHTQVIGTTNAGKTESLILPWAIQDIEQGRGMLLIDGKADRGLLEKIWAYTVKAGREKDFRLVSLSFLDESHQFNPLYGGTPEEISERVFNAFEFENPHYRALQFEVFSQVMRIFAAAKVTPTFLKVHQSISEPSFLVDLSDRGKDLGLMAWAKKFRGLEAKERETRTSGLLSALSHFAFGETARLFNADHPSVTIDEALREGRIVYFQLPVLLTPFLGKAAGKLILQSLQSAVANRHRSGGGRKFFSVFLDDFSEYLYAGFVSILNKSRSANVGVVFAHQALGDISALGESVANTIQVNSNIKVFMRGNDPASAEYFSKLVGTVQSTKSTERAKRGLFGDTERTGDTSVREVEEFVVHPNYFKRELGIGEGIMILPHAKGSKMLKMRFDIFADLPATPIPVPTKEPLTLLKPETVCSDAVAASDTEKMSAA